MLFASADKAGSIPRHTGDGKASVGNGGIDGSKLSV